MDNGNVTSYFLGNCGRRLWKFACIFATIATTVLQLNQYCNGPDGTIVEYKRFGDVETDVYPSIGACFTNTLEEKNLKKYGDNLTSTLYYYFLTGEFWDPNLLMVDYDIVTQNLDEYVLAYGYRTSDWKFNYVYQQGQYGKSELKPGFKIHTILGFKCFTIDFPFKNDQLNDFHIFLRPDIFNGGRRVDNPGEDMTTENQLWVLPHYPNQLFTQMSLVKTKWPRRKLSAPKTYLMVFDIQSVDVVQQRSSGNTPCLEGNRDYDTEKQQSILESLGCKPPYWNSSSSFPLCSKQEELKAATKQLLTTLLSNDKRALKPCRRFENIVYSYGDVETPVGYFDAINSSVTMVFDYSTPNYKEVRGVKGMDLQSFIGKQLFLYINMAIRILIS